MVFPCTEECGVHACTSASAVPYMLRCLVLCTLIYSSAANIRHSHDAMTSDCPALSICCISQQAPTSLRVKVTAVQTKPRHFKSLSTLKASLFKWCLRHFLQALPLDRRAVRKSIIPYISQRTVDPGNPSRLANILTNCIAARQATTQRATNGMFWRMVVSA